MPIPRDALRAQDVDVVEAEAGEILDGAGREGVSAPGIARALCRAPSTAGPARAAGPPYAGEKAL